MFRARLPSIFHHISQNATPARVCTLSPLDATLTTRFAKTRNTTRLKCCACHENWNTSSEHVAKVLRLPHKTTTRYETCWSVTKCHACHAKRGYTALETSKSDHCCRTRHRHGHAGLNPQTPRVKREPLLWIREKLFAIHFL